MTARDVQRMQDEASRTADETLGITSWTYHIDPISPVPEPQQSDQIPKSDTAMFSVSGTPVVGGFLTDVGEYDPKLQGRNAMPVYEMMRRSSGQVEATLNAAVQPLISADWDFKPAEPGSSGRVVSSTGSGRPTKAKAKETCEFARENFFSGLEFRNSAGGWTTQRFTDVLRTSLNLLTFGVSVHENVPTVDGGKIRYRMLADLLPTTFYKWHVDTDGRTLLALGQYGWRGSQFKAVTVPASRLSVFVFRKEGGNFWGRAMLRPAYPHWYIVAKLYRIDAIAAERNGIGIPDIEMNPNPSAEDLAFAQGFVKRIAAHEQQGFVHPSGSKFQIVTPSGRPRDLMASILHHTEQISIQALAQFLALARAGGASGNRALGQGQMKFFMLALQSVANSLEGELEAQAVRPLIHMNYGADAPIPKLVAANVQARDLEDQVDSLMKLAQAGLFVSDRPARDKIREAFAFQPETDEGLVAIRGESVSEGALAPGSAVVGKSAGAIQDLETAKQKIPAGSPGETHLKSALAKLKGKAPDNATVADASKAEDGIVAERGENVQASERAGKETVERGTVSPFWRDGHDPALRMVHPIETHVDFPAHQATLDSAETRLARLLKAQRGPILRKIAAQAAKALKSGEDLSATGFKLSGGLAAKLATTAKELFRFGQKEMRAEHDRLNKTEGARMTLAENPIAPEEAGLIAQISAERYLNELSNGVRRAASNLRSDATFDISDLSANDLADALYDEAQGLTGEGIPPISENLEDTVAAITARRSFARGRSKEAQDILDELKRIGVKAQIIRVAILDKNTCGPCLAADHKQWPPGVPLSVICEGGDLDRCEPIEVRQ